MKYSRTSLAAALVATAAVSMGLVSYVKDFKAAYKLKTTSKVAKASCAVCHVGKTKKLNPYGADMAKTMAKEKTKKLTAALLKKIEGLDSDKDGVKNGKEIAADTLPGDPKSK